MNFEMMFLNQIKEQNIREKKLIMIDIIYDIMLLKEQEDLLKVFLLGSKKNIIEYKVKQIILIVHLMKG
jgi:hypothetical protein